MLARICRHMESDWPRAVVLMNLSGFFPYPRALRLFEANSKEFATLSAITENGRDYLPIHKPICVRRPGNRPVRGYPFP
ncbi:hypothetical protein IAD21_04700 [Abditibacteriota bacterium]|nr:hypothetical protein IAD21_04700 [Abditibacteriota bacterium]